MKSSSNTALTRRRRLLVLAVTLTLLSACSGNPFRPDQAAAGKQGRVITVNSSPPGATVRANGDKLGATPLKVNIDKSFPSKWMAAEDYGVVYRVSGKMTIEKSGCEDHIIPVTHSAPANDINVTLVCMKEKPAPVPVETVKPVLPENIEQRLRKLEKLHRDGVITTDEYNQHRDRILGEL